MNIIIIIDVGFTKITEISDSDLSHGEVLFVDRYQVHMLHRSNSEKIFEDYGDND